MPLFTILILVLSTIPLAASAPSLHAHRQANDKFPATVKKPQAHDRQQQTQSNFPSNAANSNLTSGNPISSSDNLRVNFPAEKKKRGHRKVGQFRFKREIPTKDVASEYGIAHNRNSQSGTSEPEDSKYESITTSAPVQDYYDNDNSMDEETHKDVQPCGFGKAVSSLWPRIDLRRFAERDRCASVEWQRLEEIDNDDKVNQLWKAVVGSADATKEELLDDLERVFLTVYNKTYSFGKNSKYTTLYNNKFKLALEIQTPLNASYLEGIEELCNEVLPRESKIYSVDLELNLNSNTSFNIRTQLPCLMSKKPIFRISGLRMSITNIDENGSGKFTIMGVDKKIDTESTPSDSNLVVLCDNRVDAGGKIISMDGYHCRTTIELLQHLPFN